MLPRLWRCLATAVAAWLMVFMAAGQSPASANKKGGKPGSEEKKDQKPSGLNLADLLSQLGSGSMAVVSALAKAGRGVDSGFTGEIFVLEKRKLRRLAPGQSSVSIALVSADGKQILALRGGKVEKLVVSANSVAIEASGVEGGTWETIAGWNAAQDRFVVIEKGRAFVYEDKTLKRLIELSRQDVAVLEKLPSVNPSGLQVSVGRDGNDWTIVTQDLQGGAKQVVFKSAQQIGSPVWWGEHVVFIGPPELKQ